MKNKLVDLNNHLFEQLERLGDEDLKGEELTNELKRAQGISAISKDIVNNATLAFNVEKFKSDIGFRKPDQVPAMLETGSSKQPLLKQV